MEVTELETKEMVLQASDGCPGVSDSPSDTGMGSEANKNIWDSHLVMDISTSLFI